MGRIKENPRYNVLSFRVSDDANIEIRQAAGNQPLADFLAEAVQEKLLRDRQSLIDNAINQGLN